MTATSNIRNVIDAISHDSNATDDAAAVANGLRAIYSNNLPEVRVAIAEMLADSAWSQDAEPYNWLRDVSASL